MRNIQCARAEKPDAARRKVRAEHPLTSRFFKKLTLGNAVWIWMTKRGLPPYSAAFITAGRGVAYSACWGNGAEEQIPENCPSSLEALHICCMKIKVNLFIFLNLSSFLYIVENRINRWS